MSPTWKLYALTGSGIIVAGLLVVLSLWMNTSSEVTEVIEPEPVSEDILTEEIATSSVEILGPSVEGRDIELHTFGTGDTHVLLVGGIHGGYEWNSILLAYEMIDHIHSNPTYVPESFTVSIIPNLNPDGLYAATQLEGRFERSDITDLSMHTTGIGRFNANDVDLNRNFGCNWAPQSSWRGVAVSGGTEAFSEAEAVLLRDYVLETRPVAAAFWHSIANNVYASECDDGPLPLTLDIMNAYAEAANYGAVPVFDAYPITGDVEGWLASIGIAAITVELETRTETEWERNRAGTSAMFTAIESYLE